jgi:signal transduction histidine kinase
MPSVAQRVRSEQIRVLYRSTPIGLFAALIGAFVLTGVLVYVNGKPWRDAALWLVLVCVDFAARQILCLAYARNATAYVDWPPWAWRMTGMTLLGGLIWGVGATWLVASEATLQQLLVILVLSATASGAVPTFGSYLPATLAYLLPAMMPYMVWSLVQDDDVHRALALLSFIFIAAFSVLAWLTSSNIAASLRLRFENLDLAQRLAQQKRLAEQANLAKSRFLASASHDLRQPVHALGMFVSALRGQTMNDEAQRLVGHIDNSVVALDTLFTALLDISRLDAGVVACHAESFAIQPLLQRVCEDYRTEAGDKGLRLVLHPCREGVHSDPVLLERILRNVISNAVRYTQHGRVVVGCRRGNPLSIQVWDSGMGIPPDMQERVFEEFYQLDNPERDRNKGLGLGLAIVRRLASLLDCRIELGSRVGLGTVVKLSVPLAPEAEWIKLAETELLAEVQTQGLILVVDDEVAIQEAMRSLLTCWGHEVIVAGSGAEMQARIASCLAVPVLIICDYRLRAGENGIDVIQQLQAEFNADIPAMLITGDTAPERLREAQQSGFLLLHKPVPNSALRAAIGNLMARPD